MKRVRGLSLLSSLMEEREHGLNDFLNDRYSSDLAEFLIERHVVDLEHFAPMDEG